MIVSTMHLVEFLDVVYKIGAETHADGIPRPPYLTGRENNWRSCKEISVPNTAGRKTE